MENLTFDFLGKQIHITKSLKKEDLKDYSLKELKELKNKLLDLASRLDIYNKGRYIATYLGKELNDRYSPKYRFIKNSLDIYWDGYGHFVTIKHNDTVVYDDDDVFTIGKWIKDLFILHEKAVSKMEEEKKQKEKIKKEELINSLTL